jgi:hypothetical protein
MAQNPSPHTEDLLNHPERSPSGSSRISHEMEIERIETPLGSLSLCVMPSHNQEDAQSETVDMDDKEQPHPTLITSNAQKSDSTETTSEWKQKSRSKSSGPFLRHGVLTEKDDHQTSLAARTTLDLDVRFFPSGISIITIDTFQWFNSCFKLAFIK